MIRPFLLLALLALAGSVRAETVNCTPITSLPVTIGTQGVYCLKQDLATAITAGNAIEITVNNVTLDCNGYKIGGLAAGDTTRTHGVRAIDRFNTVVRNCNLRGFYAAVWMQGGAGHVIESNRMESSTFLAVGLYETDGDLVRDNYVVDTGGNLPANVFPSGAAWGMGIQNSTGVTVVGNTLVNTHATAASTKTAYGIGLLNSVGVVEGNRVLDTIPDGPAVGYGLYLAGTTRVIARGNSILNTTGTNGSPIVAPATAVLRDNVGNNFSAGISGGTDAGGNFAN